MGCATHTSIFTPGARPTPPFSTYTSIFAPGARPTPPFSTYTSIFAPGARLTPPFSTYTSIFVPGARPTPPFSTHTSIFVPGARTMFSVLCALCPLSKRAPRSISFYVAPRPPSQYKLLCSVRLSAVRCPWLGPSAFKALKPLGLQALDPWRPKVKVSKVPS